MPFIRRRSVETAANSPAPSASSTGVTMNIWLQLIICTAVIAFTGARLSRLGDVIAIKSGLGRTWVGVVMMASVTSLPELVTGVSSVTFYDLPNIAVGDAIGSCMFNVLIIALLDFRSRPAPISSLAGQGNVLTAACGIVMLGMVTFAIIANSQLPRLEWIGIFSLISIPLYLGSMRLVHLYEQRQTVAPNGAVDAGDCRPGVTLRRAIALYAVNAIFVVGAASFLPRIGAELAEKTGLGRTFVGSIFIAAATSLPELVVSFSAVRLGAVDLALGNLFGSNLFNIGIIAIDDIFYREGPILANVSNNHAITASGAIVMTAITLIGMTYRNGRKRRILALDSAAVMVVYLLVVYTTYQLR